MRAGRGRGLAISVGMLIMKKEETSRLGVGCSNWLDRFTDSRPRRLLKPRSHRTAGPEPPSQHHQADKPAAEKGHAWSSVGHLIEIESRKARNMTGNRVAMIGVACKLKADRKIVEIEPIKRRYYAARRTRLQCDVHA